MSQSKANADYLMEKALAAGITSNKELANFMGQMEIECGHYKSMDEDLHYSGKRLLEVFPGRNGMNTTVEAKVIASGGQESIANQIYGGTWGAKNLGNTEVGDGWRFHGRGYVQLTGRSNYEIVGKAIGVDLVNHPELAADREIAAKIAISYWQTRVVPNGHQENPRAATFDINGGSKGLNERIIAASEWEHKLQQGYIKQNIATPAADKEYRNKYDIEAQVSSLEITKTAQTLIADATHHVQKWVADNGLQWNEQFNQAAHSVASAAHEKGMTGINLFAVNDGQIDFGHKEGFMLKTGSVETAVASNTDISRSLQAMADVDQKQSQTQSNTQQQTFAQNKEHSGVQRG